MRQFKAVEIITTLSICYTGASVQRQIAERRVTLPDNAFWFVLLLTSYLYTRLWYICDFLFVGWVDDLRMMAKAVQLLFVPGSMAYVWTQA